MNVFNTIIICGVIQGLIFSTIVLFREKYKNKPHQLLALLVLLLSLSNLDYWFRDTGISMLMDKYYLTYIPFDLLILPIYFFFISAYLKLSFKHHKLLLIPFCIRFIFQIMTIINDLLFNNGIVLSSDTIFVLDRIDEYATITFMLFMILLIFQQISKYEKSNTDSDRKQTKWLKQLLFYAIGLCLFWLIIVLTADSLPNFLSFRTKYYLIWIGLSSLIYWLGYAGIYHLGILNQNKLVNEKLDDEKIKYEVKNSEIAISRFAEIDHLIRSERLYTDPNLSLESIALSIGISEGYVSQLINSHANTNFSTYINCLRIKEAKKNLVDNNFSNYTIVAIGLESGFNSKSAFYDAFKKATGMTPSEYKKQYIS